MRQTVRDGLSLKGPTNLHLSVIVVIPPCRLKIARCLDFQRSNFLFVLINSQSLSAKYICGTNFHLLSLVHRLISKQQLVAFTNLDWMITPDCHVRKTVLFYVCPLWLLIHLFSPHTFSPPLLFPYLSFCLFQFVYL